MGLLDSIPPDQRKIVMYGAPVVAGVALISILKSKKAATPASAATAQTGQDQQAAQAAAAAALNAAAAAPSSWQMPSTDAIGVSQLADFESSLSQSLQGLTQAVQQQTNMPSATNPTLTNQQKVDNAYQDILGRAADPGGETFWTGVANSQGIGAVYKGITNSTEYKTTHPAAA